MDITVLTRSLLCALIGLFASSFVLSGQLSFAESHYIGSASCESCHQEVYKKWSESHHALAWKDPSASTVLGKFDNSSVKSASGVETKLSRNGTDYLFYTDSKEGIKSFKVAGVIGIHPLQQYILETEPGRLQSHDVVFDVEKNKWYHLYPNEKSKAGDGLHWTGPYKNWNARCAVCHATGYKSSYHPKEKNYSSTKAEIGVGCESCHGPGKSHVEAMKQGKSTAGQPKYSSHYNTAEELIQNCAPCHSRREALTDASAPVGAEFSDFHRLALLRDGLYHADGQIDDEVYVYGSFLQSKMYEQGVSCTDCHDVHNAKLTASEDTVCLQCHNVNGNTRFPTLLKKNYSASSHHFHKEGTEAARCVNCHMTGKKYMGIDFRRDHSFRVPRPDISIKTTAPNACTSCHSDLTNEAAFAAVKKWYPKGRWQEEHFAISFHAARQGEKTPEVRASLLEIAANTELPAVVRATAMNHLGRLFSDPSLAEETAKYLADESELVRAEAVPLQRSASVDVQLARLIPLTHDKRTIVRFAVARALLSVPVGKLKPDHRKHYSRVMKEYQLSLLARSDFPETHMVLGGSALATKNLPAAEAAFAEAVRLDPQLAEAWIMRMRIQQAVGNQSKLKSISQKAREANPENFELTEYINGLE